MRHVAAGVACVLAVTACATPAAVPPPVATPDLTATVLQYRRDAAERVVQVKLENRGDDEVRVAGVELVAPGFEGAGRVPKDTVLAPGRRVDLPVPLGDLRCDADSGTAEVRVWAQGEDAPLRPPVADAAVLRRIHERECAQQRAREAVSVAFDPAAWTADGDGVLRVQALGPRAVEVLSVEGTTLFSAVPSGPLPSGLTDAAGPVDVPVRMSPQRCDPHAIGESKRGYAFGVRVRVEGQPDLLLTVEPDEPARLLLQQALLQRCGLAGEATP